MYYEKGPPGTKSPCSLRLQLLLQSIEASKIRLYAIGQVPTRFELGFRTQNGKVEVVIDVSSSVVPDRGSQLLITNRVEILEDVFNGAILETCILLDCRIEILGISSMVLRVVSHHGQLVDMGLQSSEIVGKLYLSKHDLPPVYHMYLS